MKAIFLLFFSAITLCAGARSITVADTAGYAPPMLGNGQIGLVMSASGLAPQKIFSHSCVANGAPAKVSTLIPSISPINLSINGHTRLIGQQWAQTLDMDSAQVTTNGYLPGLEVTCTFRALRQLPHMIMASVSLRALSDIDVVVADSVAIPRHYSGATVAPRTIRNHGRAFPTVATSARFNNTTDVVASSTAFIAPEPWRFSAPDTIVAHLAKGEIARFDILASLCSTSDFADPWNEAERMLIYASRIGAGELLRKHVRQWSELWRANVTIDGDNRLQQIADVALYNLYSSIREDGRRSIAPMGLTSRKYFGHIFWDADTWIFPVLAVLNPDLARGMVDFRVDGLDAARKRAAAYGYKGAMFPWEADACGQESTPTFALTGPFEHHITADVAIAAWQYYCLTRDIDWLRLQGWPLIESCADFWMSRVTTHPDSLGHNVSIDNIVGADEYAIGVDNNAFTNGAARRSLEIAASAARVLGLPSDSSYNSVASRLRFPRNSDGIILEYEGYDGATIKQADAVLLAYPLGILTDAGEIDRTIAFYDPHLDLVHGPAMSHSVMSVNYARSGRGDKAYRTMMLGVDPYLVGPFHSIAETPSNGETYFMTGAGGLLQALVFGFAGLDIPSCDTAGPVVQVSSALPSHIKSVTVTTAGGRTYRNTSD